MKYRSICCIHTHWVIYLTHVHTIENVCILRLFLDVGSAVTRKDYAGEKGSFPHSFFSVLLQTVLLKVFLGGGIVRTQLRLLYGDLSAGMTTESIYHNVCPRTGFRLPCPKWSCVCRNRASLYVIMSDLRRSHEADSPRWQKIGHHNRCRHFQMLWEKWGSVMHFDFHSLYPNT